MWTHWSRFPTRRVRFHGASALSFLILLASPHLAPAQGEIRSWGPVILGREALSDLTAIAAGPLHNLALKASGSVVAWGDVAAADAVPPPPNVDFVAVTATAGTSFGLKVDGSIVVWGDISGGLANVPEPNEGFVAIDGGWDHVLGLKQDGSVVAWGYNAYGTCNVPDPNEGFIAVSAGDHHSLGLKADGSIVAWGRNDEGQCTVPSPPGFVGLSAGGSHSLGLRADGSVVAWGDNAHGQCNVPDPNEGFVAVAAGSGHSLGLRADGSILAWGDNCVGQCDVPETGRQVEQISASGEYSIALLTDGTILESGCQGGFCHRGASSTYTGFVDMAVGATQCLALRGDGSVASWGWDLSGECNVPEPNEDFVDVAAGGMHCVDWDCFVFSLGVKANGSIVAWGSWDSSMVPIPNSGFVSVVAGNSHALGLKNNGSIVAWGWNASGQCDVPEPNTGFVAIAAGGSTSAGLRGDSSIAVWGAGGSSVPEPNADFKAVSVSAGHILGLKEDGSIVAWGWHCDGACDIPPPNTGFVAVAAGHSSSGIPGSAWSYGVKHDGTIVAWPDSEDVPAPNQGFVSVATGEGEWTVGLYDPQGVGLGVGDPTWPDRSARPPAAISVHPNPFNPRSQLDLMLPSAGRVVVTVHDLRGRVVRALLDRVLPAGAFAMVFDGRDDAGRDLPSGVYVARCAAGAQVQSVKVSLVR